MKHIFILAVTLLLQGCGVLALKDAFTSNKLEVEERPIDYCTLSGGVLSFREKWDGEKKRHEWEVVCVYGNGKSVLSP